MRHKAVVDLGGGWHKVWGGGGGERKGYRGTGSSPPPLGVLGDLHGHSGEDMKHVVEAMRSMQSCETQACEVCVHV